MYFVAPYMHGYLHTKHMCPMRLSFQWTFLAICSILSDEIVLENKEKCDPNALVYTIEMMQKFEENA